jgi:uncharacterized protein YegP (UPF0339 family)
VSNYINLRRNPENKLFYWNMKTANHRIVCDGSQGYTKKQSALKGMRIALAGKTSYNDDAKRYELVRAVLNSTTVEVIPILEEK